MSECLYRIDGEHPRHCKVTGQVCICTQIQYPQRYFSYKGPAECHIFQCAEKDAALAALAGLRTVTDTFEQRLRDLFYEGLEEGSVMCDMCESEPGKPGPRKTCKGCGETHCSDGEMFTAYDAWKEKNP